MRITCLAVSCFEISIFLHIFDLENLYFQL